MTEHPIPGHERNGPVNDLDRLRIERACERLVVAYTHLVDLGRASEVADLFTADGTWSSPGVTMTGRSEIRAGFTRRERMQRVSKHLCTNLQVDVHDADHAGGLVYITLYRADTAQPVAPLTSPELVGHYRDTFRRTDDGWRFASRVIETTFRKP